MKLDTDVNSNIIQHADDTFIACSAKKNFLLNIHLEENIAKFISLFQKNELYVIESKTKLVNFGAPKRNKIEETVFYVCNVHP